MNQELRVEGLRLVSVYDCPAAVKHLYALLVERLPSESINHRATPAYEDHAAFIASRPYEAWYVVEADGRQAGAVLVGKDGAIGISVLREFQGRGVGPAAVKEAMARHPHERFFARINPANARSAHVFTKLGFEIIEMAPHQNVYMLRGSSPC